MPFEDSHHVPHRGEDAQRQDQHQTRHHHNQDRFDFGGQGFKVVVDLPLIIFSYFLHHIIELTGFFPHCNESTRTVVAPLRLRHLHKKEAIT